jgi:hypothetical protein
MGSVDPTHLSLLLGAIMLAIASGFVGSAVARNRKRRIRRSLLLGFSCGFIAGVVLHRRRRFLNDLGAVAGQLPRRMLNLATSAARPASWPTNSVAALVAGRWRGMRSARCPDTPSDSRTQASSLTWLRREH